MSRAERIRGGDSDHWEGSLRLPALAPSGLAGHCSIIDVQYRLDLHVDPSGPSFDLVVSFPLLLGNIPLAEAIPSLTSSHDTQFGGGFTLPPPPDQFNLPPPTYTESQWGAADIRREADEEHTGGDLQFVPRYVTYTSQ